LRDHDRPEVVITIDRSAQAIAELSVDLGCPSRKYAG
jgi:hypothetical protein